MFLIWKRKGLLVPLAFIIGLIPQIFVASMHTNISPESLQAKLITVLNFILSFTPAGVNYLFCKYLLTNEGVKIMTDEEGRQYQINLNSTFFFIKNTTWTKIFLGGSILIFGIILIRILF